MDTEINQTIDNKSIEKLQYDLVRDNLLKFEDLEHAREIALVQHINLGQALINSGLITEEKLLKFLEEKLHIPSVDLETFQIDKKCLKYINYKEAYNYRILPLFEIEDTLTVAMSDPLNLFAIEDIIERTGKMIEPVISSEKCILKKINEYYEIKDKVEDISTQEGENYHWIDVLHKDNLSEERIQELLGAILKYAIEQNAHELYFDRVEGGLSVNFKHHQNTDSTGTIPELLINPFIAKIKSLAGLDPLVTEIPQLGKLSFNVDSIELIASVSAFPTIAGERVSLKIYHPPKKMEELGFDVRKIETIKQALDKSGVILVCGSSLSGKTHTIYSILSELIPKDKITMTIESITKYKIKDIYQCELNENVGFNLDKAMRFIEFQSPNIVYFEGISTKEELDFFTSLTLKNKTLITEFLADNMDDLRNKFSHSEFQMFKTVISCLIFIHSRENVEVFDSEDLRKYLS